jgi:hypothetical protein
MVVKRVGMLIEGAQLPCKLKQEGAVDAMFVKPSVSEGWTASTHSGRQLERIQTDTAVLVNIRVVDGRDEANTRRLERVPVSNRARWSSWCCGSA